MIANFVNCTLWTGDNLNILRGLNSESVDLVYLDPPFNSNANYAAPIGSQAAGGGTFGTRSPGSGLLPTRRNSDTILFHTKTGDWTWQTQYQPHDESYKKRFRRRDPDGRQWSDYDLTAKGL